MKNKLTGNWDSKDKLILHMDIRSDNSTHDFLASQCISCHRVSRRHGRFPVEHRELPHRASRMCMVAKQESESDAKQSLLQAV